MTMSMTMNQLPSISMDPTEYYEFQNDHDYHHDHEYSHLYNTSSTIIRILTETTGNNTNNTTNNNNEDDESETPTSIYMKILTQLLLFFLVFGMSASIEITELRKQIRARVAFLIGLSMQFIIMPFLGFVSVFVLRKYGLTTPMGLTLLMVTSSPGGSYSNLLCSTFNASIELSIAITSVSTMLSIVMLPANLILYSHLAFMGGTTTTDGDGTLERKTILEAIDFPALLISIGVTIAAILTGILSSVYTDSEIFRKRSNAFGTICGIALVVISILFSTNDNESSKPWDQHWSFYVAVGMPCLIGLLITHTVATIVGLDHPQIVSLSVECSYQNIAIATSAIVSMFKQSEQAEAMAVPLFYGIVESVVCGLYCLIAWKMDWTYAPVDDPICKVLCQNYGPVDLERRSTRHLVLSTVGSSDCDNHNDNNDDRDIEANGITATASGDSNLDCESSALPALLLRRRRSAPRLIRHNKVSISDRTLDVDYPPYPRPRTQQETSARSRSAPTRAFFVST